MDFSENFEVFILVSTLVSIFIYYIFKKPKNLPPGPWGLPLVGYLPFMGSTPHEAFRDLSKKYGSGVIGLQLGTRYIVVINNWESLKEAGSKDAFLGRPDYSPLSISKPYFPVFIADIHGPVWKEHRRFVLHALKDIGIGQKDLEFFMREELRELIYHIKEHKGSACDVSSYMKSSVSNIITVALIGRRLEYDDPQRAFLSHVLEIIFLFMGSAGVHSFFPFLQTFITKYKLFGYREFDESMTKYSKLFKDEIEGHVKTFDENNMRDYIDRYLLKMQNCKDPNTSYTLEMLRGNIFEFFGGGSETSSTSLRWLLLLMAVHPDIQEKVKAEIHDIIGQEREPLWSDAKQLPYIQAVLLELQRWVTIAPLGLMRSAIEDTTLQGHFIPKGTPILFNLWAVHQDPKYWQNPGNFDPGRFLNQDGSLKAKAESYAPFSIGKRACPGETMAHLEVFLFFVTLLQKFTVHLPKDVPTPVDLRPKHGSSLTLEPRVDMLRLVVED